MLRLSRLFFTFLALSSPVFGERVSSVTPGNELSDRPCPDAQDILPCVCYLIAEDVMSMDCSDVTSEYELAQVFQSHFPFTQFYSLNIINNQFLTALESGVFGEVTFEVFNIADTTVATVERGALSGSYKTATEMNFCSNVIESFPFDELPNFESLTHLDVSDNYIENMTSIASKTLQFLNLAYNPLGEFPESAFTAAPSLQEINLNNTEIDYLVPGIIYCHYQDDNGMLNFIFDKILLFYVLTPAKEAIHKSFLTLFQ